MPNPALPKTNGRTLQVKVPVRPRRATNGTALKRAMEETDGSRPLRPAGEGVDDIDHRQPQQGPRLGTTTRRSLLHPSSRLKALLLKLMQTFQSTMARLPVQLHAKGTPGADVERRGTRWMEIWYLYRVACCSFTADAAFPGGCMLSAV